uniref:Histone-lysine N-methyltransferase n=1 Tax=Strigamia maritima TaxID=126957 RepID=T1JJ95_STRMM
MAAPYTQQHHQECYFDTCDPVLVRVEKPKNLQIIPFEYSQCNIPGPGADTTDFLIKFCGCNCVSSCDSTSCSCLQNYGTNYDKNGLFLPHDSDGMSIPVIECNSSCTCSQSCKNRQVQHGIQIPLCVYWTYTKGWGLKTLEDIPNRKFVCEYAGEIINHDEAKKRCKKLNSTCDNYLLAVLEHLSDGQIVETYVDPRLKGNVGRFINHSCEPNLKMVPIRVENTIPKFCLFAQRNILAGEELTFDYSGDVNTTSDVGDSNRKKCLCNSDKCGGFLPFCHTLFD